MTPADSVRRLMQTESCCRAESVLNLARWINDFDIASRSKQMVSKEGPKMGTNFFPSNTLLLSQVVHHAYKPVAY